jgi:hypothetical protein
MAGRFFRRGKSKFRFATAVANIATPTRAEITSSVPLSNQIAEVAGFGISNSPIPTPDLDTEFTKQIEGEDTTEDSRLTFYDEDAATNAIRTALAKGTDGYILYLPYGDIATRRMEVWPVRTTGVNDIVTVGNDAARYVVGFAVTDEPEQDAAIPAAV